MKPHQLLFAVLWILALPAIGSAQFTYEIESKPDSADVYMNGALQGKTPIKVKFDWKSVPDSGLVFLLKHEGYLDTTFKVVEKPRVIKSWKSVKLEKWVPHFKLDSASALIEFDKLLAEFPSGKQIGQIMRGSSITKLTWEGFSRLGGDPIGLKTYDVLGSTGFNTPMSESNQLFSNEKRTRKSPRFLLGAKVSDLWVDMNKIVYGYAQEIYDSKVSITVEWQVFDRTVNQVVLYGSSSASIKNRFDGDPSDGVLVSAYGDALTAFIAQGKLFELINSAGTSSVANLPSGEGTETDVKTSIPLVKISKFETNPEMIQYATQAAVTIATDAGHGSGVLVSEDGYVLTAAHVIEGVNRISVVFSNGVELDAKLISLNTEYDIALLDVPGSKYKALPIGTGLTTGLGEEVYTIGTPGDLELGQSISKGILSGKRKHEEIVYIQTDVAVSPGNSGGPLLNNKGQIIGIIQRKLIGAGIEGVGFALPIETALKQLKLTVGE
jgi:S1-C subfamily serine protease